MLYSSTGVNDAQHFSVAVTAKLYEALQHIRREDHSRVFWIDAICINQNDLHERSQQVAMMKEIYSNATRVVVWLGLSNPGVEKTIQDARHVMKRYQDARHVMKTSQSDNYDELHHPIFEHGWYHIDTPLFQYDWFRRTWVLQEVFNAKSISVYCGNDVLPWSLVLRLNECINRSMLIPNPIRKNVMTSLLTGLFQLTEDENKDGQLTWVNHQGRHEILDVVVRGLDLDATDPRDKIFALLCFGNETANVSQLPPVIRPDYTKSLGRVFADFTRWWISTHKSVRILSSVHVSVGRTWQKLLPHRVQEDSDRASWSLWHDGKAIWSIGTLGLLPHTPPYSAGGSTVPDMSLLDISPSPMVLRLRGRIVSTIASLSPYPYYIDNSAREELHTAYNELFDPVNTRGTWKSIMLQTGNFKEQPADDERDRIDKLKDHLKGHYNYISRTAAFPCHHEAFFATPEGKMGLCPAPARVGDIVVVLDGGNVPYLIRLKNGEGAEVESETQYEFIGECYLYGYMHGRAVEESNEHGILRKEVFNFV